MGPEEAVRVMKGLEHLFYEGWDCTGWRRLHRELIVAFQYSKGACRKAREGLFIRECSGRTRENSFQWKEGRFGLDIRKKFFTMRMVRH